MAKFPEPPSVEVLASIPPVLVELPAETLLTRLFFMGGPYPTQWNTLRYFGPTANRFDHHLPDANGAPFAQDRGVMYAAVGSAAIPTCLAEVFQMTRLIDRHASEPVLTGFRTCSELSLLDLSGPFATAIGASMAINSGPRPRARRWAQALYAAYPDVHGLFYSSSMNGGAPALVLFERAVRAIPERPTFHRLLNDPVMESVVLQTGHSIGYQMV